MRRIATIVVCSLAITSLAVAEEKQNGGDLHTFWLTSAHGFTSMGVSPGSRWERRSD